MSPIPAVLITGADSDAKTRFISALAAARPAGERWAVLDNDGGNQVQADTQLSVASITGCLCCTGQVALQTGIVRLIRQSRPQRLFIVASGAAEPAALERALRQEQLARAVQVSHRLCVATAEQLAAGPPAARELWLQQLRAADFVVAAEDAAAETLSATLSAMGYAGKPAISAAAALLAVLQPPVATGTVHRSAG